MPLKPLEIHSYPERSRFMKGIFASAGFRQTIIEYSRPKRIAGSTKWSYLNLYRLAVEGIVAYTSLPLKVWSYIGGTISISAFIFGFYLIVKTLIFGIDVPGYASIMVVLLIMTGSILLSLGIIGEYLSRIYNEVKQRPIYIVQDTHGFESPVKK
jgi:glycosyltransferase involved in cell wall biosynthesis